MDSDAALDGEVDHSFFDSDCEGEGERDRRQIRDGRQRSPSGAGERTVTRLTNVDSSASAASPSASSSATSVSRSSSSVSSRGEFARFRTKSPNYSSDSRSSSSGRDEAGDRSDRSRSTSPRTVPASRWLHRGSEAALSDLASNYDSDIGISVSCRASPSSPGKRPSSLPTSQWRTRPSTKTRKGRSQELCRTRKRHEDTEGTVTDVTPLSSPGCSPIHSNDQCMERKHKTNRKKTNKKQENVGQAIYISLDSLNFDEGVQNARRQKNWREAKPCKPSSTASSLESKRSNQRRGQKIPNDATDLNQLWKAMTHLEKKELQKIVSDFPEQRQRKNYTFSNEEAKRIDRENQRLLQELTRKATRPTVNKPKKMATTTVRVYHSTLNRQREQERIERENLAFLKRLEAVKPTVGLKRSTQLYDYQRQMSFMESCSQQSRPSTRGSISRLSSRSSVHKTFTN